MGTVTQVLADTARRAGAEIIVSDEVAHIETRGSIVTGVSTTQGESAGRFLNVLVVRRKGAKPSVSKVSLIQRKGQLGVEMVRRDGNLDIVLFRTDRSDHDPVTVLLRRTPEK